MIEHRNEVEVERDGPNAAVTINADHFSATMGVVNAGPHDGLPVLTLLLQRSNAEDFHWTFGPAVAKAVEELLRQYEIFIKEERR